MIHNAAASQPPGKVQPATARAREISGEGERLFELQITTGPTI